MILFIISLPVLLWIICVLYINDLKPDSRSVPKKVLAIFPHPDDEVLSCSGVLAMTESRIVILTKGERGNPDAELDKSLKPIREKEAKNVSRILGTKLKIHDLGDGELEKKKKEMSAIVESEIKAYKPDVVITYDLSGLYGHPDHITVAKVVHDVWEGRLWTTSLPKKILENIKLPEHMATDKDFFGMRKLPNIKVFIGLNIIIKIRALYAYRSQLFAFRSSYPRYIPLWFIVSLTIFEYFHEKL